MLSAVAAEVGLGFPLSMVATFTLPQWTQGRPLGQHSSTHHASDFLSVSNFLIVSITVNVFPLAITPHFGIDSLYRLLAERRLNFNGFGENGW